MPTTPTLRVPRLGKEKMAQLSSKARRLGISPERYVQLLIEEDLELDRRAKTTRFAELMGPGRELDERVLDRVVDGARMRHHKNSKGKR